MTSRVLCEHPGSLYEHPGSLYNAWENWAALTGIHISFHAEQGVIHRKPKGRAAGKEMYEDLDLAC